MDTNNIGFDLAAIMSSTDSLIKKVEKGEGIVLPDGVTKEEFLSTLKSSKDGKKFQKLKNEFEKFKETINSKR